MQLFFDVTRLVKRAARSTPTGIDRVDYAYAYHCLTSARIAPVFVVASDFGPGAMRAGVAETLLGTISHRWRLNAEPSADRVFMALSAILRARPTQAVSIAADRAPTEATGASLANGLALWDRLRAPKRLERNLFRRKQPARAYLHASHGMLDRPDRFDWLVSNGMPGVFFVHDAIPLEFPEYCRPNEDLRHAARLGTVARHASLLLTNSQVTANAMDLHFARLDRPPPPIRIVPLGVGSWFDRMRPLVPIPDAHPYFVMVGTIEPRKNHVLMLTIWRRLVERHGENAPRLVIIGRRGWENENVLDLLERSPALASHVVEVGGVGESGLASIVLGARALLAPSLAEGFGLPVTEALALGVPVIASSIEAHREVARDHAHLIDPLDGLGWLHAIEAYCAPNSAKRESALQAASTFRPVRWADHVGTSIDFISEHMEKIERA